MKVDILIEFVQLCIEWFDGIVIYKRSKPNPLDVCLNNNYDSKNYPTT